MSLYVKMAAIMAAVGNIEKDGTNAHFNYKFVTDSAVYNTVRQQLSSQGIAVFASMTDVQQTRYITGTDKYGKETVQYHTRAQFEFVLVDSETGETKTCTWFAESLDNQDKGINKAATAGLKYWLLKTFIIPTGDDPDAGDEVPAKTTPPKQDRRIPAPKQEGAEPPAPPASEPSELDEITWTRDHAVTAKMVSGAGELWKISGAHLYNRVARALGLEGNYTRRDDLLNAIAIDYKGSKDDARAALKAYKSENAAEPEAQTA